ncbi:glycosyl hydrolase [Solimonas sp. K1W22B-7]|uniref:glycoside hydrolase family 3 C-terminal domain-containing protein n=1 Tax=Solimonas sp. K1W22B-7 TaxID=2303331 RepID=UPI000E33088C|nr:glycoside hydrolase family 3 C-terminal domain-containing protein [Solimonas sp. K1W22B-7]AXQ30577.1 glycosyl hydrolase [Solimonas sp. K1W22B-7]
MNVLFASRLAGLLLAALLAGCESSSPVESRTLPPAVSGGDQPPDANPDPRIAQCPWMDATLAPEQRAEMLIAAMSQDQKLHMTSFGFPGLYVYYGSVGHISDIPELCIPALKMSDGTSGIGLAQLGTTTYPAGIARAAAWDPELAKRFGEAVADEALAKGINVWLGPGMNIARSVLNGRQFEYHGEDPLLSGETAAATIRGVQSRPVLTSAKHFVANDQETERMTINVNVDERTLREIYLPPFEASVKAGAATIMCSYNRLNGPYACENPELINGYLRRDWGFDGFVMTDWGAMHSTIDSVNAGTDMEMAVVAIPPFYGKPIGTAIDRGELKQAQLDTMMRHIFVPMFREGLFDHPPSEPLPALLASTATPAHRQLARSIGEQSMVLLKNDGELLPLDRGRGRRIALIGAAASPVGAVLTAAGGGGSRPAPLPLPVSPQEGIGALAATRGDTILYADGTTGIDATLMAAAADLAIVVVAQGGGEDADIKSMSLGPWFCGLTGPSCLDLPLFDQDRLVETVAAANPNTIVVVNAAAPIEMPWIDQVRGLIYAWFPGTENGNALANLLYGEANPSGHLPISLPKAYADTPTSTPERYPGVDGQLSYSEGLQVGYRWYDAQAIEPLFPFGFGLSYTSFEFSGLSVTKAGNGARLKFRLRNSGARRGAEVSQVYVEFPPELGEPPRQLKGFRKVFLEPGESQTLTLDLDARAFSYWDTDRNGWVQGPGCYGIRVGSSSRDLPLAARLPISGGSCAR